MCNLCSRCSLFSICFVDFTCSSVLVEISQLSNSNALIIVPIDKYYSQPWSLKLFFVGYDGNLYVKWYLIVLKTNGYWVFII